MTYVITLLAIAALLVAAIYIFLNASPASIAQTLRSTFPILAMLLGAVLSFSGRSGLGAGLVMLGIIWWNRNRRAGRIHNPSPGQSSTVRSALLEMHLDHETGDLDGVVLAGSLEGSRLSSLPEEALWELNAELAQDAESHALLEAYLDRRIPGWRDDAQRGPGSGHGAASGTGPMTKEEAYQILGLEPGAPAKDIRQAHRRLMKRVHPDSGGSTFLAARINQAKETLLN